MARPMYAVLAWLPWQVNAILAILCYAFFKYLVPSFEYDSKAAEKIVKDISSDLAVITAAIFIFMMLMSALNYWRAQRHRDRVSGMAEIRKLKRQEFINLVCGIYRRKGCEVTYIGDKAAGQEQYIVTEQDKHYLVYTGHYLKKRVGANELTEAHQAYLSVPRLDGVIYVTTGLISDDGYQYARGKSIELIDGTRLSAILQTIINDPLDQTRTRNKAEACDKDAGTMVNLPETIVCNKCGRDMQLQSSKTGVYWQCEGRPECMNISVYQ